MNFNISPAIIAATVAGSGIGSAVGFMSKGEQAENNLNSNVAIMNDLRNLRESISGVNIDEELADIIKFQHGYNAAAKFVTVWDSLIDTVINRLGV